MRTVITECGMSNFFRGAWVVGAVWAVTPHHEFWGPTLVKQRHRLNLAVSYNWKETLELVTVCEAD